MVPDTQANELSKQTSHRKGRSSSPVRTEVEGMLSEGFRVIFSPEGLPEEPFPEDVSVVSPPEAPLEESVSEEFPPEGSPPVGLSGLLPEDFGRISNTAEVSPSR